MATVKDVFYIDVVVHLNVFKVLKLFFLAARVSLHNHQPAKAAFCGLFQLLWKLTDQKES